MMISFTMLHTIGSRRLQNLGRFSQPPYSSTLPVGGSDIADSSVIEHAVVQTPSTNIDTIALESSRHLVTSDTLDTRANFILPKHKPTSKAMAKGTMPDCSRCQERGI